MATVRGIVLEKVMHESEGEEVLRLTRDVTVPISGEVMYEVAQTLKSRITIGGFREWHQYELAVDASMPARITVVILTPFPNYPVWSVHKSGPSVAIFDGGSDLGV